MFFPVRKFVGHWMWVSCASFFRPCRNYGAVIDSLTLKMKTKKIHWLLLFGMWSEMKFKKNHFAYVNRKNMFLISPDQKKANLDVLRVIQYEVEFSHANNKLELIFQLCWQVILRISWWVEPYFTAICKIGRVCLLIREMSSFNQFVSGLLEQPKTRDYHQDGSDCVKHIREHIIRRLSCTCPESQNNCDKIYQSETCLQTIFRLRGSYGNSLCRHIFITCLHSWVCTFINRHICFISQYQEEKKCFSFVPFILGSIYFIVFINWISLYFR